MWQLASDCDERLLRIDPAASDQGAGTMCGLAEAGTTAPPSNAQLCARLYWPLAKSSPGEADQRMVAVWVAILVSSSPAKRGRGAHALGTFTVLDSARRGLT